MLNVELPYDPGILLLYTQPREIIMLTQKNVYTNVHISTI